MARAPKLDAPALRRALLRWYRAERRDLPWRTREGDVSDPWRVLVSEAMLQQTTVATVLARYEPFLRRFPTPAAMAEASEGAVLEAWSGLGYYGRARRLRQAAAELARPGAWPETADKLRRLPGFGPYTAAAVASIAFGEPVAAVDTNVVRVVARLTAERAAVAETPTKKRIEEAAQALLAPRAPGDFNQAMMELGATLCRPRAPLCDACPARRWCAAAALGAQEEIPKRVAKRMTIERHDTALAIVRFDADGGDEPRVLVWRRPSGASVYRGMLELPTWRGEGRAERAEAGSSSTAPDRTIAWIAERLGMAPEKLVVHEEPLGNARHTIMHFRVSLELRAARLDAKRRAPGPRASRPRASRRGGEWPSAESPDDIPVHHEEFGAAWIPLFGAWDAAATPQRKLLALLRGRVGGLLGRGRASATPDLFGGDNEDDDALGGFWRLRRVRSR